MRYPVLCLCVDRRDAMSFASRFALMPELYPDYCAWNPSHPARSGSKTLLCVARGALDLFRLVPLVSQVYAKKRILVLVPKLALRVATLPPSGPNIWFQDEDTNPCDLQEALLSLRSIPSGTTTRRVSLTQREQEVFQLLYAGYTTREISRDLGIAASTVNCHKKALFTKFRVRSTAQMIAQSALSSLQVLRTRPVRRLSDTGSRRGCSACRSRT